MSLDGNKYYNVLHHNGMARIKKKLKSTQHHANIKVTHFFFDGWYEVGWPEQVSGSQGECPNKTFGNLT